MKATQNLIGLLTTLALAVFILAGCQVGAEKSVDYKYYSQDQLKSTIDNGSSIVILDVQVEEEFNAHHIEGAVATYAFPVKSQEDKAKIDTQLPMLEETDQEIVIVCPKGRVGAERTYQYLIEKGIAPERLFILEGGQAGWTSDSKNDEDTAAPDGASETDRPSDTVETEASEASEES